MTVSETERPGRNWGRIVLLPILIAVGVGAVIAFHLDRYLTFEALAANRAWLLQWVNVHSVLAISLFVAVYVLAAALSVPGAAILTLASGYLFGPVLGAAASVAGATAGATLLFLVARTSFGEVFRARAEGRLQSLQAGFSKDAFSYLLFLRLVPLFPFWLVNLVAAFMGVRLRTFMAATFLGIVPGSAIYAAVGGGLGGILDHGGKPNLGVVFTPPILIPILALALLSLAPVAWRRLRGSARG